MMTYLLKLGPLLCLLQQALLSVETSTVCNFGSGCLFPCHCADQDDVCDPLTGHCDTGCGVNLPDYTPSQAGWRGDGCQTGNVAYNKRAWQYHGNGDRVASRAVDGVVDRSANGVSQPALAGGGGAWWTVDLGALHTVYSVRMMNADLGGYVYLNQIRVYVSNSSIPDNNTALNTEADIMGYGDFVTCGEHPGGWFYLNHIRVYVSNSSIPDNNAVLNSTADIMGYGTFVTCGEHPGTVPQAEDGEVVCGQPLVGRYVLLWKYGNSSANRDIQGSFITSEVSILGHPYQECTSCSTECNPTYGCMANCPAGKNQTTFCSEDCGTSYGTFGVNCGEICSGHCANGAACDKTDGSCPGGCELWWTDSICGTQIDLPQSDVVRTLEATDVTSGSVTLTWDPLDAVPPELEPHYGYVIGQMDLPLETDGPWMDIEWVTYRPVAKESLTVRGLHFNSRYGFRLQVYRQHRDLTQRDEQDGEVSVKTSCIAPRALQVYLQLVNIGNGDEVIKAANVTWDAIAPADSGCDFIKNYVFANYYDDENVAEVTLDNRTTSYLLQEHVATTNVITVTAINNENLHKSTAEQLSPPPANHIPLIAGVTVSVVALVTVVIVVLVLWRRRSTSARGEPAMSGPISQPVSSSGISKASSSDENQGGENDVSVIGAVGVDAGPPEVAHTEEGGYYDTIAPVAVTPAEYTSLDNNKAVYQN